MASPIVPPASHVHVSTPRPVRRPLPGLLLFALALLGSAPDSARGQGLVPGVVGGVGGMLAGGYVTVGIWTARARAGDYLYDTKEALGWGSIPVVLGTGAGVALGTTDRDRLERSGVGAVIGAAAGTGVGVLVGRSAWLPPEGAWAGGIIGGAAGLVIGATVGALWPDDEAAAPGRRVDPAHHPHPPLLMRRDPTRPTRPAARRSPRPLAALPLALLAACAGPEPPVIAPFEALPEPDPTEVDAVLYLVGDAGTALPGRSPLLARVAEGVERWSGALARDSAVSVHYLGDIVYPVGVRAPGTEEFPKDSLHVQAQVDVVAGPRAREFSSPAYFMSGNHDWGMTKGGEGRGRLANLADLLRAIRAEQGVGVSLIPEAGEPGPAVLDLGARVRVAALDTHWWLQPRDSAAEARMLASLRRAMETAGERDVVVTAHHPYASGGPHGGPVPIWRTAGVLYLLRKSGSLVQDVNSRPYKELVQGLTDVFRESRAPFVWAGGHDHSLQVIEAGKEGEPRWVLVSGSGSKLTQVHPMEGMLYGAGVPGFIRLTWLRSGEVQLHVFGAAPEHQHCKDAAGDRDEGYGPLPVADDVLTGEALDACMRRGIAAYDVRWARRVR